MPEKPDKQEETKKNSEAKTRTIPFVDLNINKNIPTVPKPPRKK